MSKDRPSRNPRLNPAGLPPREAARHRHITDRPPHPADRGASEVCRFISSYGGTLHCQDEPYLAGFCRFHYGCLRDGEISPLGRILDSVTEQARRREINLHGLTLPRLDRLPQDPLTGRDPSGGRSEPG